MLNRRILIVDDNPEIHTDFRKILAPKIQDSSKLAALESQLFGDIKVEASTTFEVKYDIDSAHQGSEALRIVTEAINQGQPYAMIFMDVRMPPGWDGIETTKRIWDVAPITEVVLCTAYSDYSYEEFLAALGLSHRLLFLKKPFDAVAVKQMALATTTKWNFEADARNHTDTLEQAVQERTRELVVTQSQLQQSGKMAALGEMAGGIAHEINTPLGVLTLNCDTIDISLEGPELDREFLRKTNNINLTTVERIAKIVRGLLNFARDGSKDPFKPVAVGDLVRDTVALCQARLHSRGVKLKIQEIDPAFVVNCRAGEICQVLLNLLNNSLDAIEQNLEKWIELSVELREQKIFIGVADSGAGISDEIQNKIFQPFFTTKDVGKGTGLGLSISLGIAAANGGLLTYDRQSPNTKFILQLPALVSDSADKAG